MNKSNNMNGWRECKLGDIVVLNYGKGLKEEIRVNGDVPVYSSSGLSGWHNEPLVNSKGIIVGRKGTIGKVYKSEKPFFCIDTAYYILPNDEEYDFDYLYYCLQTLGLEDLNSDSAVPGLNRNAAYNQDILLPPLPEQRAIAAVLSSLDDKIDLLNRQNKTLEAMAETLFRQWFIEPCKNGLPEGWREGKLPDEFDFKMGASPPGESYNEDCSGIPMFQGNADFGFRFPQPRVYTTEPVRFAKKYDTLISVRAPVGEQNMAQEECCIGRGVAAFRCKHNCKTYTYYKLKSLMSEIKSFNDTGTVFGSISKTDFESIEIMIPSKSLILDFELMASPIDNKIIHNCHQIRTLEKLRDLLLPKLISGEIRV